MKVSKSGFYECLSRKKPNAQIEREALEGFAVETLHRHKGRYGYRRIDRELRKSGIAVSEKRVHRIMQKLGLAGKGATRKRRIQKKVEPGDPRLNLAEHAFSVGERNRLWVGDITYIPASEGRLYLAAAIDAFSRKAAGRSMSGRIAEKVAIDAIGQAVGREGPPDDGSLVFHDDQGAQRASRSFRRCLGSHGMVRSASRSGTPPGNAVAESFSKTLKRELAEERSYGTRDEAKQDIFKHIELYCNRARMHSALGHMSPVEYERQYARGSLKESPVILPTPVRSGEPAPFGVTRVRVCFAAGNLRDSAGPVSLRSGISRFRSTHLPCCSNGYWESSDAPSRARMTSIPCERANSTSSALRAFMVPKAAGHTIRRAQWTRSSLVRAMVLSPIGSKARSATHSAARSRASSQSMSPSCRTPA